jgi:ribosome-associated translation inhibitor RaiA
MLIAAHVTFKGLAPHSDVESLIHQQIARLADHYDRLVDCRIRMEVSHRHHGAGNPVHVLIELAVPGDLLVVDHVAEQHQVASDGAGNPNLCAAVREAIVVVQRQLAAYVDRQRRRHPRQTATHI